MTVNNLLLDRISFQSQKVHSPIFKGESWVTSVENVCYYAVQLREMSCSGDNAVLSRATGPGSEGRELIRSSTESKAPRDW